jgi:hypothetical protein
MFQYLSIYIIIVYLQPYGTRCMDEMKYRLIKVHVVQVEIILDGYISNNGNVIYYRCVNQIQYQITADHFANKEIFSWAKCSIHSYIPIPQLALI